MNTLEFAKIAESLTAVHGYFATDFGPTSDISEKEALEIVGKLAEMLGYVVRPKNIVSISFDQATGDADLKAMAQSLGARVVVEARYWPPTANFVPTGPDRYGEITYAENKEELAEALKMD